MQLPHHQYLIDSCFIYLITLCHCEHECKLATENRKAWHCGTNQLKNLSFCSDHFSSHPYGPESLCPERRSSAFWWMDWLHAYGGNDPRTPAGRCQCTHAKKTTMEWASKLKSDSSEHLKEKTQPLQPKIDAASSSNWCKLHFTLLFLEGVKLWSKARRHGRGNIMDNPIEIRSNLIS